MGTGGFRIRWWGVGVTEAAGIAEPSAFRCLPCAIPCAQLEDPGTSTFKGVTNGSPYTTKGPPLDTP